MAISSEQYLRIEFTSHARRRMQERRISAEDVWLVLTAPDEVNDGDDGELIATRKLAPRMLSVVYVEEGELLRVLTVLRL
ncbi:MAG: DUF4258 domain-containing protein [Chloroflexi bacterium]|nr:DUF4258 domain-containing protein [Chloroflexota bacterium]